MYTQTTLTALFLLLLLVRGKANILPAPSPAVHTPTQAPNDCEINIQVQVNTQQKIERDPLVLKVDPNTQNLQFLYPDKNGKVEIKNGEAIIIDCPGGRLLYLGKLLPSHIYKCHNNTDFTSLNSYQPQIDFNLIECITSNENITDAVVTRPINPRSTTCPKTLQTEEKEVGFFLQKQQSFAPVYTVCFDKTHGIPIYSKYLLTRNIKNGRMVVRDAVDWHDSTGLYQSINFLELFNQVQETNEINSQTSPAAGYIKTGKTFLNKGHFTAFGDFVYRFQRYATFQYINMAPQWNQFNGGNWNTLEEAVRNHVATGTGDIDVYTGAIEVAQLHQTSATMVDIHLGDKAGNKLNVPRWFWKITYGGGTSSFNHLFLGYNNVYGTTNHCSVICKTPKTLASVFPKLSFNNPKNSFMCVCPLVPNEIYDPVLKKLVSLILTP